VYCDTEWGVDGGGDSACRLTVQNPLRDYGTTEWGRMTILCNNEPGKEKRAEENNRKPAELTLKERKKRVNFRHTKREIEE